MFGSTVLDVAAGLIFVFLAVSLASGALTEAVASLFKLRQRTLLSGIQALLNDEAMDGLARDLYKHALVNPLSSGREKKQGVWTTAPKPAAIAPSSFALALLAALKKRSTTPAETMGEILGRIDDEQLKQVLTQLWVRAKEDEERFVAEVGRWFDDAMERVGGWYKRYTQVIAFATALLVAGLLDADAIRIAQVLWKRPTLVAELGVKDGDARGSTAATAQNAIEQLDAAGLFGWTSPMARDPRAVSSMVSGWLIVAGASLFGAPFWFDLLQRVGQVAGVGRTRDKASDA